MLRCLMTVNAPLFHAGFVSMAVVVDAPMANEGAVLMVMVVNSPLSHASGGFLDGCLVFVQPFVIVQLGSIDSLSYTSRAPGIATWRRDRALFSLTRSSLRSLS
jgi:hypothetical protein